MNKAFKKYGKSNWRKTRLSNKHKSRVFIARCNAGLSLSFGLSQIIAISRTNRSKIEKAVAIVDAYIATMESIVNHCNKIAK